ncbi:hypothetical protein [Mesorhizobium sp. M1D.F.Ca.ET.043.01.1.1]|uniref:hypothetical protein n=1 Tax=Mesorhizobium sp. M1D.F.Ca.ET.043.01.1.1 TaxID=2493669 RepID=UPI00167BA5D7|nr:hypothetical protein [Mesorhizobium sp. M1D.F.Ca.ET.043.01.1.1]
MKTHVGVERGLLVGPLLAEPCDLGIDLGEVGRALIDDGWSFWKPSHATSTA